MNGEETDELPERAGQAYQAHQAMVDAMMSPDADRAIEIFRRVVADGMKVPDPDRIAGLAAPSSPAPPRRAPHRLASRAVPWSLALFGIAAVAASLGWSYADYNTRQEEWQRIAQEQTALAEKQAEHLAKYQAWKQEVTEREARLQERRQRQISRLRDSIDAGQVFDAAVRISVRADELLIEGEPTKEDLEMFVAFVDELVKLARSQAASPAPPASPSPKE